jgi:hypothetical protein
MRSNAMPWHACMQAVAGSTGCGWSLRLPHLIWPCLALSLLTAHGWTALRSCDSAASPVHRNRIAPGVTTVIASGFPDIRYAVAVDAAGNVFVFDHVSAIASTAIAVQRSVSPPSARVRPSAHGQANTHWRSVQMPSIMLGAQGRGEIIRVTPSGPCSRERNAADRCATGPALRRSSSIMCMRLSLCLLWPIVLALQLSSLCHCLLFARRRQVRVRRTRGIAHRCHKHVLRPGRQPFGRHLRQFAQCCRQRRGAWPRYGATSRWCVFGCLFVDRTITCTNFFQPVRALAENWVAA